jgi:hypothetical protein
VIRNAPTAVRAESGLKNLVPAVKPKGAASIPRTPPPVHKQTVETVTGKGGRVNQRA